MTGAELARRLEVSPRTVQRYITRLQDLGIPVEGRRGVGGSYRLKAGFRLPPLMFNSEEALSVTLGLYALKNLGLHTLASAAYSASAKLARTLPLALRETAQAIEDAVQIDTSPWVVNTDAALLAKLLQCVRASLVVQLGYNSKAKTSTRKVNIYRLVHLSGRWYVVGWCHLRANLRCFRLDKIEQLTVLDETFIPPEHFDALACLSSTMQDAPTIYQISVWLNCSPEDLQGRISTWHTSLSSENGGTRLSCQRDQLESFAAMLLGLGHAFKIENPPELLIAFKELAKRCAAVQVEYHTP